MKKNIVLVGGSGFIGTHTIEEFIRRKTFAKIYVLDLVPPRVSGNEVVYIPCDIRKPFEAPVKDCDIVVNLAALCKEPGYPYDEYFATNFVGAKHVCDFARAHSIRKMVFVSTMMVFRASDEPMTEDSPTCPDTGYGISKLLGEKECLLWRNAGGKNSLYILRPAVVFGKHENGNYTRLYRALKKRAFAYVGRTTTIKASIYVKDVAAAIHFFCVKSPRETIHNLAIPRTLTIKDICDALADTMGVSRAWLILPFRLTWMLSFLFEWLAKILPNPIHHRRVEKLYESTNIVPSALLRSGFAFSFDLHQGMEDWKRECGGDLY
ncbi:MAG: NAD(P)-dependent oxidoreductase [Bacteroidota bacterium]